MFNYAYGFGMLTGLGCLRVWDAYGWDVTLSRPRDIPNPQTTQTGLPSRHPTPFRHDHSFGYGKIMENHGHNNCMNNWIILVMAKSILA